MRPDDASPSREGVSKRDPIYGGSSARSPGNSTGIRTSGEDSGGYGDKATKGLGIQIPRLPSNREDDYFVVKIQFSRKAAGFLVALFIVLSRLFEALGIEFLRSVF